MHNNMLNLWARWTFWHIVVFYIALNLGGMVALFGVIATTSIVSALPQSQLIGLAVGMSVAIAVVTTILGLMQWWIILQHHGINPGRWLIGNGLASMFGCVAGMGSIVLLQRFAPTLLPPLQSADTYYNPVIERLIYSGALAAWLVLPMRQWTVLRAMFKQAIWWIPASILGSVLSLGPLFMPLSAPIPVETLSILGIGAGYGALTGIAILWLVHSTTRQGTRAGTLR